MSHQAQVAVRGIGLPAALALCVLLLFGQDNAQNIQTSPGRVARTPLQINITGCLKKDAATGGYYISDENGRTWELSGKKVDLAEKVFHTVNVSGHPAPTAVAPGGKSEASQTAGGKPTLRLDVVELTMISNSCTR